MSDSEDKNRPEHGNNVTQRTTGDIDWSQFYDMFMNIERRLPDFDHMLLAMNDYAFQRTSSRRETNDLSEFCGVREKGFINWCTSSTNNKINMVPNFIDLTSKVFDDDILMKVDKELVSSTRLNADTSKITGKSANADASKNISTSVNADTMKNISTSPNTNACKSIPTSATTNACKSTHTSDDADVSESTNTSTNTEASKSTSRSANISSYLSASSSSHISASTCNNKRARMSTNSSSALVAKPKHFYEGVDGRKAFESFLRSTVESTGLSTDQLIEQSTNQLIKQLTETNVDTDNIFDIIMPSMTEDNIYQRSTLPIDRNTHLGYEYERHWWRQTNDTIILNVDISDLVEDSVPNINVVVSTIGFEVKIKRPDKWIVLLSNKFEKAISKSTWVINKHMHIKLTVDKREKEFWSKCLVTETREIDTSYFKNHACSNVCSTPLLSRVQINPSKKECLENLTAFLKEDYGIDDLDSEDEDDSTETNSLATEENPQDSATTLNLSVDPSTVKSLNSDSENPPNTKQTCMDSEVPPNLAISCDAEVPQNQSDTSANFKSVKSSSHP